MIVTARSNVISFVLAFDESTRQDCANQRFYLEIPKHLHTERQKHEKASSSKIHQDLTFMYCVRNMSLSRKIK